MNKILRFSVPLAALVMMLVGTGCVGDGTYYGGGGGGYYGGGGGYYGDGYGPGYYGAPGPVVVAAGPVYRETVVVDGPRYRYHDGGYYEGRRPAPDYREYRRRGGDNYSRRAPVATERRGSGRRTPAPVYRRGKEKRPSVYQ